MGLFGFEGDDAREKVIVLLTMCFALAMVMIDNTVVNVALPTLNQELGASISDLQWIVDSYVLVFASLLLTGGILGDRYGRKRMFLAGLAIFTASSLACGLADSSMQLIAARAAQGVGAQAQIVGGEAVALEPRHAVLDPAVVPVLVGGPALDRSCGLTKYSISICSNSRVRKMKLPGRDLVAERPADLARCRTGSLRRIDCSTLSKLTNMRLGGLRAQVGDRRVLLDRAHEGLEHEIELARRRQLALAALRAQRAPRPAVAARLAGRDRELVALGGRAVVGPRQRVDLVGAEAPLALAAVHHGIGEVVHVAARLPHRGVHEDGRVEARPCRPRAGRSRATTPA